MFSWLRSLEGQQISHQNYLKFQNMILYAKNCYLMKDRVFQ